MSHIYLTFPSETSFTDEDVSYYFSDFGTVEDVRIPYQQQRMYGFVTFSNAETVRIILARGNPHFICDSRVLVKPYKEKGKILQNKWQQQHLQQLLETGSYSASSSPSGMDLFECHLGPRMLPRNTQEMMRISIGSPAHLPPRFNYSLLFQPESSMEEATEGFSALVSPLGKLIDERRREEAGESKGKDYSGCEQRWVPYVEEAFVAFARCVRRSKLVGIGFVEDYYPNRVAMQFGFSQDLPGLVTHHSCNFTEKEAWDDYNKSLVGGKLYMPSRLASGSITARYRDWWSKSVSQFLGFEDSNETCDARNRVVDDDAFSPEVLPLSEVLQKMGEGFPEKLKRPRKLRIARRMESEIKKCKTGGCGESVVIDVPLSELFHKELARRPSEDLRDKRRKRAREDNDDDDENHMDSCDDIYESYDMTIAQLVKYRKKDGGDASGSLGIRRRDNNDSRVCQELASGDDETVAPQEIEPQNDEEEIRSVEEGITILIPCVGDTVMPPTCDDEVDVNGRNNLEKKKKKKKTLVNDGTKEPECLLHDDEKEEDERRLNQRKLTTEELALNLEALYEGGEDFGNN
ncbi:hypothetical protein Bca52824_080787 [Brassica carinata]|uniref:RRM domain-containing protein n=1 Tax=Brassica carinata TaxID=52824 RepID=A0A8X7TRA5_BRACI|nr:hypothetical protein Bca52824_080787 [Brassica carinata]